MKSKVNINRENDIYKHAGLEASVLINARDVY